MGVIVKMAGGHRSNMTADQGMKRMEDFYLGSQAFIRFIPVSAVISEYDNGSRDETDGGLLPRASSVYPIHPNICCYI